VSEIDAFEAKDRLGHLLDLVEQGEDDTEFRRATLADLAMLDIAADTRIDVHAWAETLRLADRFRLTAYDAAYLELARRRTLPLATLDDRGRNLDVS
jgi:predicted nucleic acid-binding protein